MIDSHEHVCCAPQALWCLIRSKTCDKARNNVSQIYCVTGVINCLLTCSLKFTSFCEQYDSDISAYTVQKTMDMEKRLQMMRQLQRTVSLRLCRPGI